MEEMQQHQGEWFFLHELNVDKVFSTIQRADYLILYYIKVEQETRPGEKLYLADHATKPLSCSFSMPLESSVTRTPMAAARSAR